MPTINDRIARLREQLAIYNLDAWIINGTDPHQSEYVAPRWQSRAWISGFTGSAGSVLVTADRALLWVDSRYFIQAEGELKGSEFTMMKLDTPGSVDMNTYLISTLQEGGRVGIASETLTVSQKARYETAFAGRLILVPSDDLLTPIWSDRPPVPAVVVTSIEEEIAGLSVEGKLEMVRTVLQQKGCDYTIISGLDDIAWLTNLRGGDVSYNPVFYSYLLISHSRAWLFSDLRRFSAEIREALNPHFELLEYDEVGPTLARVIEEDACVYYDSDRIAFTLASSITAQRRRLGREITTDLKASKNSVELEGMRRAHLLDGVALVNFLAALDTAGGQYTELEIIDLLEQQRKRNPEYLGPSFSAISGWNANGALPHYRVTDESNATVAGDGLLVLDTGAHYRTGMTDVTRTILFGVPSAVQKRDYTLVLKGNLALASARFIEGTCGYQLDVLARQFLWQEGLSYFHGTGHGIGFRLNVHEGPQSISPRPLAVPLVAGMIVSDEPGLYREGQHGIRIENIIAVQEDVKTEFGQFLSFEVLTISPFERTLIEKELLTEAEVAMVDAYHRWVYRELKALVDEAVLPYLEAATAPL
jgi:Xaa-Pro aminopeptidase